MKSIDKIMKPINNIILIIFIIINLFMIQCGSGPISDLMFIGKGQDLRSSEQTKRVYARIHHRFLIHRVHSGVSAKVNINGNCVNKSEARKFTAYAITNWLRAFEQAVNLGLVQTSLYNRSSHCL